MINVVYFNQWFSSITPVIKDLKDKFGESVKIIGSSKNPGQAYRNVVDTFIEEDCEKTADDYVNWFIKTVNNYCIDIAFIYKHQDWIASDIERISKCLPNTTIVLDTSNFDIISKKSGLYKMLKTVADLECYIPRYWDLTLAEEFNSVLDKLRDSKPKSEICLKLDSDVGGESFRKVVYTKPSGLDILKQSSAYTIQASDASTLLLNLKNDGLEKIMCMEYLYGPEISVDCYDSNKGFISICRSKGVNRVEEIFFDKEIHEICKKIYKVFNLSWTCNIQFRYADKNLRDKKHLRITDLNLRLSGGSYLELEGDNGINLCEICILDILDKTDSYSIEKYQNFKKRLVTHFETAIEIKTEE